MGRSWEKTVAVEVLRPYVIEVTFEDGIQREIDLGSDLWGPVFEPLRDYDLFRRAAVDPLGGSVCWPTGADLAPEFLYLGESEGNHGGDAGRSAALSVGRGNAGSA